MEELVQVGEDLKNTRIKLKDVVKTIEEDDPTEDEMNQRQRVIFLLDEVKVLYKKKRKIYDKLDACAQLDRRVTAVQNDILSYKEEIVTRLRDIKIEKTLVDRIIETVSDYVRQMHNCQRDLSAYVLSVGKSRDEIVRIFKAVDDREMNPVNASDALGMTVDEFFSFKEMLSGKMEITPAADMCCHNVDDLEEVSGASSAATWPPCAPSRSSSAPTCALWCPSPRSTPTAACSSWTSSRRATSASMKPVTKFEYQRGLQVQHLRHLWIRQAITPP